MDPGVCREHLTTLLREEAELLAQLEELLAQESRVLETSDIQTLETTTRARQERMGALARIDEQRRSLYSRARSAGQHSVTQLDRERGSAQHAAASAVADRPGSPAAPSHRVLGRG